MRVADIDRFRDADRRAADLLYRRVFGHDAASASGLRWHWQYSLNPNNPPGGPQIWLAREGPSVVGQFATMPVRLAVKGVEIAGSWGTDVCVAPERQRQGIGEALVRAWDQDAGAALGVGLSPSSQGLFRKLRWPESGTVPCLVKPLTRRALRNPRWPVQVNRLVSAVTWPFIRIVARSRPLGAQVEPIRHFDERFTGLWTAVAPAFDLAVRRDAPYLNWKYAEPPHVRYSIVALKRDEAVCGYAVYRHAREARGRVTLLVDFLASPDDRVGFETLLRWVDREARAADSDTVRVYATSAAFRRLLRKSGYFGTRSAVALTAKINAVPVPEAFYERTGGWHVTLGDSDLDR